MKPLKSALLLLVVLAFAGNVPAHARPASHSGTSSFKSGFSSQKSNPARHSKPAPPPANRQSGPGAFGQAAGSPAQPQRPTSAMSRDAGQGAARDNALRTLDQRRNAANSQPLPPLQPVQPPAQRPAPAAPYQQPAASGNGLMAGVMGFMLGRAMSQSNQPVSYPTTQGNQPAAPAPDAHGAGMVAGMPGLASPATRPAPAPAPAPQTSFLGGVLRWFALLGVLSVLLWAVLYSVRKHRRLRAAPTYSFERNG